VPDFKAGECGFKPWTDCKLNKGLNIKNAVKALPDNDTLAGINLIFKGCLLLKQMFVLQKICKEKFSFILWLGLPSIPSFLKMLFTPDKYENAGFAF